MLKKILSINNVGKFIDYSAYGDIELRTFNIIYADNGRGKTTLTSILKSLKTGDENLIKGRRTLGSEGDPSIEILLENNNKILYKDGKWTKSYPRLEIFDENFILENVYTGNCIDHNHKRNLHSFIVGEKGVNLADEIEKLDEENKTKATEIREKEGELKEQILGKMKVPDFIKLTPPIEGSITKKEQELNSIKTLEEIAEKGDLKTLDLPSIQSEKINKLLSKSISSITKETEETVSEHISRCMDEKGELWIETGLKYVSNDKCPFCYQSLDNNRLFSAYKSFFDKAYQDLKNEIDKESQQIKELLSENSLLKIQGLISSNKELTEFWKNHLNTQFPEINFDNIQLCLQDLRKYILSKLSKKSSAPLETISPLNQQDNVLKEYISTEKIVEEYNNKTSEVNKLISTKKKDTEEADLAKVEEELWYLHNRRNRNKAEINKLCEEFKELLKDKKCLESEKNKKKKLLDEYASSMIEDYAESINDNLKKCGAGFEITELERNYIGGKPRTEYCLKIEAEKIDLGNEDTSLDEPSFKNTLSSGDKSALAFSFFISKIKQSNREDLKETILVFDDPASSLDIHRRAHTCHQMIWFAENCKQVIVLTHNLSLAREIWEESKHLSPKSLQIIRKSGNFSVIDTLNIIEKTKSEYFKDYDLLTYYVESGPNDDDHMRLVARSIRPLLEGYLRIRFPKSFLVDKWLGDFISLLRDANPEDEIYQIKTEILDDLDDINKYSKKYHHENPNFRTEPINDTQLRTYVERTFKIIC